MTRLFFVEIVGSQKIHVQQHNDLKVSNGIKWSKGLFCGKNGWNYEAKVLKNKQNRRTI